MADATPPTPTLDEQVGRFASQMQFGSNAAAWKGVSPQELKQFNDQVAEYQAHRGTDDISGAYTEAFTGKTPAFQKQLLTIVNTARVLPDTQHNVPLLGHLDAMSAVTDGTKAAQAHTKEVNRLTDQLGLTSIIGDHSKATQALQDGLKNVDPQELKKFNDEMSRLQSFMGGRENVMMGDTVSVSFGEALLGHGTAFKKELVSAVVAANAQQVLNDSSFFSVKNTGVSKELAAIAKINPGVAVPPASTDDWGNESKHPARTAAAKKQVAAKTEHAAAKPSAAHHVDHSLFSQDNFGDNPDLKRELVAALNSATDKEGKPYSGYTDVAAEKNPAKKQVMVLQHYLQDNNFQDLDNKDLKVDGDMGPKTREATRRFLASQFGGWVVGDNLDIGARAHMLAAVHDGKFPTLNKPTANPIPEVRDGSRPPTLKMANAENTLPPNVQKVGNLLGAQSIAMETDPDGTRYAVFKAQTPREVISSVEQKRLFGTELEKAGIPSTSIDTNAHQQSFRIPEKAITDDVVSKLGAQNLETVVNKLDGDSYASRAPRAAMKAEQSTTVDPVATQQKDNNNSNGKLNSNPNDNMIKVPPTGRPLPGMTIGI